MKWRVVVALVAALLLVHRAQGVALQEQALVSNVPTSQILGPPPGHPQKNPQYVFPAEDVRENSPFAGLRAAGSMVSPLSGNVLPMLAKYHALPPGAPSTLDGVPEGALDPKTLGIVPNNPEDLQDAPPSPAPNNAAATMDGNNPE